MRRTWSERCNYLINSIIPKRHTISSVTLSHSTTLKSKSFNHQMKEINGFRVVQQLSLFLLLLLKGSSCELCCRDFVDISITSLWPNWSHESRRRQAASRRKEFLSVCQSTPRIDRLIASQSVSQESKTNGKWRCHFINVHIYWCI